MAYDDEDDLERGAGTMADFAKFQQVGDRIAGKIVHVGAKFTRTNDEGKPSDHIWLTVECAAGCVDTKKDSDTGETSDVSPAAGDLRKIDITVPGALATAVAEARRKVGVKRFETDDLIDIKFREFGEQRVKGRRKPKLFDVTYKVGVSAQTADELI